jgi:hypothetical protein
MEAQHRDFFTAEHFITKDIGNQCEREVQQQALEPSCVVNGDFGCLDAMNGFNESGCANGY